MSKATIRVHQRDGDWSCYVSDKNQPEIPSIEQLLEKIEDFDVTLKDDRRSLVKLGQLNGQKVVAKQHRDKNRRKWSRLLSLIGAAEAKLSFITLIEFKEKGIESLTPICLLEKKRLAMVVDSWLLYEYREGRSSDRSYLPQIIEQLKIIHRHGYRHEDPNFDNFLIDANGAMFLIDCRGKRRSGLFSDYYDFILLEGGGKFKRHEVEKLIDIDPFSIGYWQARIYRGYIDLRTKWKELIGRRRSKDDRR